MDFVVYFKNFGLFFDKDKMLLEGFEYRIGML